jgi:hypothetical protein
MAVIYLRHPVHGAKVATMDLEADYDEQNGWERFDPDEVTAITENAIVRRRRARSRQVTDDDNLSSGHYL